MYLFEPLDKIIQDYLLPEHIELIKRAFVVARDAHEGQFRSSGEPYITHPVAVASIIADMRLDHEAIMAALLHDVIEDTPYTEEQLTKEFGKSVAEIVNGVSKLDKLKFRTRQEAQAESFRKMILAMTKDIRVVLIKLADRTHNMRTLGALRPEKRRRIAKETLEIYSPLAHRLGIERVKNELEDLCFQAMHPQRYAVLNKVIEIARNTRQELVHPLLESIQNRLSEVGIPARVFIEEKPLFYIYQNMRSKNQQFRSIMDISNFRIIVDSVDNCYRVLGQMHNLFKPRSGMIKDYIAVPKANGYQALHTSTIGPRGVVVEIQIRTEEMNLIAELGVTAHWIYKPDGKNDSTTAQIKAQHWLQSIIELQQSAGNSFEFIESVKSDLFSDEIYVFTPKGRIIELPAGATPIDFAYAVHTSIGSTCIGAKVDREVYSLSQPLRSGQTVEIITSPTATPNESWLNFVVTGRARNKIRQTLKTLRYEEAVNLGKRQLLHVLAGKQFEDLDQKLVDQLLDQLNLNNFDDLLAEIGLGNQLSSTIARHLCGQPIEIEKNVEELHNQACLPIKGIEGLLIDFAKCCHPIPGDPIIGYSIPGKGLVIHHELCSNLKRRNLQKDPQIKVEWEPCDDYTEFETELNIRIMNEPKALANLMAAISSAKSNIYSIWTENGEEHEYLVTLTLTAKDTKHLAYIIRKIQSLSGVQSVQRNINE
ncbi:bifunctional GTP diphosphokinase/guanosine-3',5'-bis pyrophosphate 3'-pyrophosphohydrolase [Pasteurella bettyae]|uniref:guanosine-3',5'-bis(diphosphate) 3'-diphosphatase n=1 Tax=Pasteurella bettyae CCUG 2042 TaxID=1095749 RepID=I3DH79_9PAST|nr:bifunctional GTP diphosphokinase/guanosine-3',5'-bis pyrophosphate 3'-pyrophosphohydrolase [Pasteurella bettyae]EIJ71072.1 guanosine 3',5'-bis(pyrophosphate) 3'-pyrophosphohydrolase [Pasteurella bettyae CCUG 2042]SUB22236.1 guanosine-3',5'-bis(diphosphate) 3'-pyrophosphohydrolase [Pasteurella bettyae]